MDGCSASDRGAVRRTRGRMRINKFLAECGVASRRACDKLIEEGKVKVALHGYERAIRGKNEDGTVYVSVRDLLSQMGYDVGWADGKVTVEYHKNA